MDVRSIPELVLVNLSTGWDARLFAVLSCVDRTLRDLVRDLRASKITNQGELNALLKRDFFTTALDIGWSPRFPVSRLQLRHHIDSCQRHSKDQCLRRRREREADVAASIGRSRSLSKFQEELVAAYVDGLSSQLDLATLVEHLGIVSRPGSHFF